MIGKSILIGSCAVMLSANTTMCYKKNHLDPSSIETTYLDGGKCDGKLSVNDMQKSGYIIKDIKIHDATDGMDYIYIFTKSENNLDSKLSIKNQLQQIKEEESREKISEKEKNDLAQGKKIYLSDCVSCHGKKAELEAYNSSRKLITLSVDDMIESIRDYNLDQKDNGMAHIMKPYADSLVTQDVKNVAKYINTLK